MEDESDAGRVGAQRLDTEWAGLRAVRQRDLTPVRRCLFRADMSTRDEGVGGGLRVHVEARLAAEPQRHVGPPRPTHGTLPILMLRLIRRAAAPRPAVVPVHVATAQIHPGLLLHHHGLVS